MLPYQRFLVYLALRRLDVEAVLRALQLPPLGDAGRAFLEGQIRESAPPSIDGHVPGLGPDRSAEFLEWAENRGMRELWEAELTGEETKPALEVAFGMFTCPPRRAMLALAVMTNGSTTERTALVREATGTDVDDAALNLFGRIFWDAGHVDPADWKVFFASLKGTERDIVLFGLRKPSITEARRFLRLERIDADEALRDFAAIALDRLKNASAPAWGALTLKALSSAASRLPTAEAPKPVDYHNLFSVKVQKTRHVTLQELLARGDKVSSSS